MGSCQSAPEAEPSIDELNKNHETARLADVAKSRAIKITIMSELFPGGEKEVEARIKETLTQVVRRSMNISGDSCNFCVLL